jgi:exonuclease III
MTSGENDLVSLLDFNDENEDDYSPNLFTHSPYYEFEDFISLFESKKDVFSVVSVNCQSLHAKLNELHTYVQRLSETECFLNAICLQETWINANTDISLLEIPGYNLISRSSSCSTHGGVAIYLRDCHEFKVLQIDDNHEIWDGQFIEIALQDSFCRTHHKKLIIGNVYRPPRDNIDNYNGFIQDIETILNDFQRNNCEVMFVGDFNIDLLKIYDRPI